jgi:hypothetical protein
MGLHASAGLRRDVNCRRVQFGKTDDHRIVAQQLIGCMLKNPRQATY